jgi:GNAT superfamily N-acetyltransferase
LRFLPFRHPALPGPDRDIESYAGRIGQHCWQTGVVSELDIRLSGYERADAQQLIAEVQAEYVRRYGGPDETPVDPAEFVAPQGLFVVGYANGAPVALGGWRKLVTADPDRTWGGPRAEIKRMYVAESVRGLGFARAILAHLEQAARAEGIDWLVLETGSLQPEAIALYRSSGYQDVPAFSHYACAPLAVHLGKRVSIDVLSS